MGDSDKNGAAAPDINLQRPAPLAASAESRPPAARPRGTQAAFLPGLRAPVRVGSSIGPMTTSSDTPPAAEPSKLSISSLRRKTRGAERGKLLRVSPATVLCTPNEANSTQPLSPSMPPNGDSLQTMEEAAASLEREAATIDERQPLSGERSANTHADWLLVLAKCTVPAFMVGLSGVIAIPLNNALGDSPQAEFTRAALEQFAGGALIGTYAIELSRGYIMKDKDGNRRNSLVAATLIGTFISGQVQCLGQAFWPYGFMDSDPDLPGDKDAGDAVPFAIGFFVDGVILAYERSHDAEAPRRVGLWARIRPAFTSVLTIVMSVDNAIDGIGMYSTLDPSVMPTWAYYAIFVAAIYAGGVISIGVQRIPSPAVQAAWYAFGAFAILDGGMELATSGLTNFVLAGFLAVWVLLIYGNDDD